MYGGVARSEKGGPGESNIILIKQENHREGGLTVRNFGNKLRGK